MIDLTKITTPFALLDEVYGPGTQDALKAHGGLYQVLDFEGWRDVEIPSWSGRYTYRVKPQPESLWVVFDGDGTFSAFRYKEDAEFYVSGENWKIGHYKEVTE